MGKIAVLDQLTIDKIAAGEVVERPASVAKELVENAIDAGAVQITIEIREGGIGFLRITDNGSGIEKEDIPLAFLPHSTSKIRTAEDLLEVASLGFRGEALSSISAVSKVELISKTRTSVLGNRCCMEGGVQKELEEIAAPDGTTFIVRDLFYNTPARKKFLKTETTEAAAIHEMLTHLALSHPEISFKVLVNQQIRLQTTGNGKLKDVIYQIYGREVAANLLEVKFEEEPVKISGFIGTPELSRGNRSYENYFVNGRFVKSQLLTKAIEDAYRSFLPQHRYPFVCLNLQLDNEYLDVNVHPTKLELRFSNENQIYRWVNQAIQFSERQAVVMGFGDENSDCFVNQTDSEECLLRESSNYQLGEKREKILPKETKRVRKEYKIIGQVFDSYYLVQVREELYIIDFCAVYEKLLYEELIQKLYNENTPFSSQILSVPMVLNFQKQTEQQYLKFQSYFQKLGFEIEGFGEGAYMVRAVPKALQQLAQQKPLLELMESLSDISGEINLEKLITVCCRVAAREKHKLSKTERKTLLDKFLTIDNPYELFHRKPVMISMTKQELEKKFK